MRENPANLAIAVVRGLGRDTQAKPKDTNTSRDSKDVRKERAEVALPANDPPDATDLCVSCGLCCNGVLYSNIKVQPDEVERLEAAGHPVEQVGERLQFHPPCHHHQEGRCTIYATRFMKCRTFRCALLKRFDTGQLPLTDALAAVDQAKKMVARIAALAPDLTLLSNRVAFRQVEPPKPASLDAARAKIWVESMALDMFLDRTFRNRPVVTFGPID